MGMQKKRPFTLTQAVFFFVRQSPQLLAYTILDHLFNRIVTAAYWVQYWPSSVRLHFLRFRSLHLS